MRTRVRWKRSNPRRSGLLNSDMRVMADAPPRERAWGAPGWNSERPQTGTVDNDIRAGAAVSRHRATGPGLTWQPNHSTMGLSNHDSDQPSAILRNAWRSILPVARRGNWASVTIRA